MLVQNVMVDMTFNLGVAGFRSLGTFISDINNKEWASAQQIYERELAFLPSTGSRCTFMMLVTLQKVAAVQTSRSQIIKRVGSAV